MEPTDAAASDPGSIAGVAARLLLWGRRAPSGLACVEFDSDFSRQQVDARVREACEAAGIPYYALELPRAVPAPDVVTWIKQQLASLPRGVVSITGWATAFPPDVPLLDSLRVLNYNRENLAQFPLCQIWWLTRPLAGTFIREILDLNSWFIVRLSLDENIIKATAPSTVSDNAPVSSEAQDAARRQAADLAKRFDNALQMDESVDVLVRMALSAAQTLFRARLFQEASATASAFLSKIGDTLQHHPRYANIEGAVIDWPQTWERLLNFDDADGAFFMSGIGWLYKVAGNTNVAEGFYKASVKRNASTIFPAIFSGQMPVTELADIYNSQARYAEAEALYRNTISKLEQSTHPNLLILGNYSNGLSDALAMQGRFGDAETYLLKALAIRRLAHGVFLTDLPGMLQEVVEFYNTLGRYAEADVYQSQLDELKQTDGMSFVS